MGDSSFTSRIVRAGVASFIAAVVLLPHATSAAAPQITVELSKLRIYEGESVLYVVTITDSVNSTAPKLEGFIDFNVVPAGRQAGTQTINGKELESIQFRYALTPKRTGMLSVPAPTAEVDGKLLRGRELTLQVIASGGQDLAVLTISADRETVYPTQQFTVTLTVDVKALPPPREKIDPLSISLRSSPLRHLQIPWLVDEQLPKGIRPQVEWRRWIAPYQSRAKSGFAINSLARRMGFSIHDDEAVLFQPTPKKIQREGSDGKQAEYWRYQFARNFVAEKVGTYTFGPVTLKGWFATAILSGTQASGEQILAKADPIRIAVIDVPTDGRPPTYIGGVGTFDMSAELLPRRTRVGDPMTLTLALSGRGTLEDTYAPDLKLVPEIADNFKVDDDVTQETSGDTRSFTYSIRPLSTEIKEFPPVPVSYFDVTAGQYVTLRSNPIPIEVSVAERLSESDIVATSLSASGRRQRMEAASEGILANVTDRNAVRDQTVRPGRWFAALLSLAGLYAVVAIVSVQIQRTSADTPGRRRRGAVRRARRRLRAALDVLSQGHVAAGAEAVRGAVTGLVADVADLPAAGLTWRDVRTRLATLDTDPALVDRVDKLLNRCDAAQYGSPEAAGQIGRDARQTLVDLIGSLKSKKLFR